MVIYMCQPSHHHLVIDFKLDIFLPALTDIVAEDGGIESLDALDEGRLAAEALHFYFVSGKYW